MANSLKNTKVTFDLLLDTEMLLMLKKVSVVEYVMLIIDMQKVIIDRSKERAIISQVLVRK